MDLGILKDIAAILGAIAALWAIYVYFTNSRVRRAEWLASLYEKFYEKSDLKAVREILDCEAGDSPDISRLLAKSRLSSRITSTFFEFVAVLKKSHQLSANEIESLFGYYLDCLEKCGQVRKYIANKGYEHLNKLLQARATR